MDCQPLHTADTYHICPLDDIDLPGSEDRSIPDLYDLCDLYDLYDMI